ncbi:MAG: cytidine deaminase [Sphingobacteriales bacterium]|jgi:cytidine deaminase|nr:MAG: cytidine deaminase [Sphingobacteriales bacterium]
MQEKNITIQYQNFDNISDLPSQMQMLIQEARAAQQNSYAPYSKFNVGAALLLDNNKTVQGSNQENASYPIGLCAERTAISACVALYPNEKINAIAIVANSQTTEVKFPVAPCGICRQVLLETESKQKSDIQILLHGNDGSTFVFKSIKDLLPLHFDAEYL